MPILQPIHALIFDWGDTIMQDFNYPGPMSQWPEVVWIPGAKESLKTLSRHYPCIIATSADHSGTAEMIAALKRVGADCYFRHFFASNNLGYKKPDPRFFTSITRQLAVDQATCVMIGNLYGKDIVGAKEAGLQTVLFDRTNQQNQFPRADAIIHDMHNLKGIIPF